MRIPDELRPPAMVLGLQAAMVIGWALVFLVLVP
jgi:hypothetical protein